MCGAQQISYLRPLFMISKVLANLKIAALSPMQNAAIAASENSDDMLLLSPTGSGKTLAFLILVLKRLNKTKQGVQALVLVPSRELGLQIEQVFKQMCTGFKVNCCYGGHATRVEKRNLEHPPALLVGTPGRIAYHIRNQNINTNSICTLVLDEFDKSLEFGFHDEMKFIISDLRHLNKRILTSATVMEDIPDFTGVKNLQVLNFLSNDNAPPIGLKLKTVKAEGKDKIGALFSLLCTINSNATLVFCNHRDAVERISDLLFDKNILHGIFHGGMEQEDRERTLIKFRNGSHRILVCTDLASRGLDIPEIETIVHYQLPVTEEVFTHRNGRTARMHAKGIAYLILGENEYVPDFVKDEPEEEVLYSDVSLPAPSKWKTLYFAAGRKNKINKIDIVGLLLQKGNLQKEELGLIEVLDFSAYAAVKADKINKVVAIMRNEKIKNKKIKIEISE
jgi:ATP-independent RNA helicase DbpA